MAPRKKQSSKVPLHISSLSLTTATETILKRLSQDATDFIGRGVSTSAVVRALAIYASQQPPTWIYETLFPLVEQELGSGIVWGKKKS